MWTINWDDKQLILDTVEKVMNTVLLIFSLLTIVHQKV